VTLPTPEELAENPGALGARYWRNLERRARRYADEMARLDETDPERARRIDRARPEVPPSARLRG
jgi:hypothetical protein